MSVSSKIVIEVAKTSGRVFWHGVCRGAGAAAALTAAGLAVGVVSGLIIPAEDVEEEGEADEPLSDEPKTSGAKKRVKRPRKVAEEVTPEEEAA